MHTNHEKILHENLSNGLADLITLPLSGYFANDIRRGNILYLPEVHGLPDSAVPVLLKIKKFHNKDMMLVRHFLTLTFDINRKPEGCCRSKKYGINKTGDNIYLNDNYHNIGNRDSVKNFDQNIHPRVNLYALPINVTSRRLISGKSKLLRVFHFDNTNLNIDVDKGNFWSSIEQIDLLQNWIERIAFRVVSSGHLLPPQVANPPLENNECQVVP